MKLRHIAMLFATLFLPACSNSQDNTSDVTRLEMKKIEDFEQIKPTQGSDTPILISTFNTKVYTKTEARMNNLNIVCNKISGKIIQPGEEFSYNDIAGPFDKEHGFGKATILMKDGSEVQGYGGGVCQVSSTLYNAVKDCGVKITERHNHSKDVYYVPRNQDATVSYGSLDFRFKNLNNYPLQIQASANKQYVTVEIYKI